jgi:arsenate reductase
MAEAFLRTYAGDHFDVYSAGLEEADINPLVIKVMEELGYDLSSHYSKKVTPFLGKVHFGILITVCSQAEEKCPVIPGLGTRLHWPFEDPSQVTGTESEKLEKVREIRDQIKRRILEWLTERDIPFQE